MLNKFSRLVALCLLISAPLAHTESKMKLDTHGDGQVSFEKYQASKEKGHERQFKKWTPMATVILMLQKSKRKSTK